MKKENGITLVALVVTIIVLIILAGISINLVLGQNGIINKAKQAKENMEIAAEEEARMLNELYIQMGTEISSSTPPTEDNEDDDGGDDSKINDFKIAIADYIAEAGGIKPEYTDNKEIFGERIKGIVKEVSKNATATADNIREGYTAYVNGELITGNGADIKNEYERGYAKGVDDTIKQNNVQIIRHTHNDQCKCTGKINCYNSQEFSGNAYHGMTYYYRCSNCSYTCNYSMRVNHYWDSDGDQHFHDPVYSGTYPVPSSCSNSACGKEAGVAIDILIINGVTYNINNGTVTEN